jgi:hypothetical protein
VRTGRPLDFHSTMSDSECDLYHRSMRAIAGIAGREVWRTPFSANWENARSCGSWPLCRFHLSASSSAQAQVLDLPDAIEKAARCSQRRASARVVHVAGTSPDRSWK